MECTSKLIKKRLPFPFITHDKLIRKKAYFKGQSNHEQLSTAILEVGAIMNDKSLETFHVCRGISLNFYDVLLIKMLLDLGGRVYRKLSMPPTFHLVVGARPHGTRARVAHL